MDSYSEVVVFVLVHTTRSMTIDLAIRDGNLNQGILGTPLLACNFDSFTNFTAIFHT